MSFSSVIFLFVFFPVVLLLFLCIHKWKNIKAENALLILSSVVFYAWGGIRFLLLLFLSVVINYFLGRGLEGKHKKLCFRLAHFLLSHFEYPAGHKVFKIRMERLAEELPVCRKTAS